jgi:DNA helicase II / ATP-dependent DNA helicase PcrA
LCLCHFSQELSLNFSIDLNSLNPPQREAVEHGDGPTLVLAGAGSGKTRVLTHKIAWLVYQGSRPWEILAVTFTNKAAREMAARVEKLLNIPVKGLWIGTFHGICVRILRREADRWGFRRDFTIYDRDDQLSMVKKVLREQGITKERLSPHRILGIIGKAKNDGLTPDDLENTISGRDSQLIVKSFRRYREMMEAAGAFDFDDLLIKPVEMFKRDPESLIEWQNKFTHILVDEYQDTNHTQYLLMKMLSGESGNITVVGDDDQSIYSWRGANIRNILDFEHDFSGVKTVRLEENYRSTSWILKAANAVVKNNMHRMSKELWTNRTGGEKVFLLECYSDRDEAEKVISYIEHERKDSELNLGDFAILYRTNAQSRSFEDVIRRRGMKYVIVGGIRFYERREIKDILAYLRLLVNPGDIVSFSRAVSNPKRGIGAKTVESIEQYARDKNIPVVESLNFAREYASGSTLRNINDFRELIASLSGMLAENNLDKIVSTVIEKTGYLGFLENEEPVTFEDRAANLDELVTALAEFSEREEENDLNSFLAEVSLVSDVDTWYEEKDALTLMSLHAAKGLEFPSVYIVGVENGLFPLPQSMEEDATFEEERRLFYVGITRAKNILHISYALMRPRYGSFTGGPSTFIRELPLDVLNVEKPKAVDREERPFPSKPRIQKPIEFEDYPQAPEHASGFRFKAGEWVSHPLFGRGKINSISGTGEDVILTVKFGAKEIKIMPKFARLKKG